jgi:hypothetical protein
MAKSIGEDGNHLLKAISEAQEPALSNMPEILAMERIWKDQYVWGEGKISWKKDACAYCSTPIQRYGFDLRGVRTDPERRLS